MKLLIIGASSLLGKEEKYILNNLTDIISCVNIHKNLNNKINLYMRLKCPF